MKIGTHNGVFHADDVLAVASLKILNPVASVVRTRATAELIACTQVVDVGGVYSHVDGRYDHHQIEGAGARDNGVPYSSFGLVWHHYGHLVCQRLLADFDATNLVMLEETARRVDEGLVQRVDALDCGYDRESEPDDIPVSEIISAMVPSWLEDSGLMDEAFHSAVSLAQDLLRRAVIRAFEQAVAYEEVRDSIESDLDELLVLERFLPWQEAVFGQGLDALLYVVFPDPDGQWRVQAVPDALGSFGQRKPLPKAWAGLRDSELADETGVEDAVFCHRGRFICGARSRTGALRLAKLAVDAA